jgi:hypothetical protein
VSQVITSNAGDRLRTVALVPAAGRCDQQVVAVHAGVVESVDIGVDRPRLRGRQQHERRDVRRDFLRPEPVLDAEIRLAQGFVGAFPIEQIPVHSHLDGLGPGAGNGGANLLRGWGLAIGGEGDRALPFDKPLDGVVADNELRASHLGQAGVNIDRFGPGQHGRRAAVGTAGAIFEKNRENTLPSCASCRSHNSGQRPVRSTAARAAAHLSNISSRDTSTISAVPSPASCTVARRPLKPAASRTTW